MEWFFFLMLTQAVTLKTVKWWWQDIFSISVFSIAVTSVTLWEPQRTGLRPSSSYTFLFCICVSLCTFVCTFVCTWICICIGLCGNRGGPAWDWARHTVVESDGWVWPIFAVSTKSKNLENHPRELVSTIDGLPVY